MWPYPRCVDTYSARSIFTAKTHDEILQGKARQLGERLDSTPTDRSSGEQTLSGYAAVNSVDHAAQSRVPTGSDVAYPVGTTVEMFDGPTVPDYS